MNASQIPFSLLSVEAVLELATQTGETISSKHADDAMLSNPLQALDEPKQQATLAIGSSRKQELTEQVNEADRMRDRGFIGFRKHVEADQFNDWSPKVKEAADRILDIIQQHGTRLHQEGLTVQSALMTSLFEDLDAEAAKTDLATLRLTRWIEELKEMQNKFADLFRQRNELESVKDIPTKAAAKDSLVEKLSIVLNGLDFLTSTQPDTYADTSKLVTEIVNRIVTSERGR
ncbi:MAG: DUF6261 family protein [Bacteroidota bacterium]